VATSGMLEGVVEDRIGVLADFAYDLEVRVPSLNNYAYTILSVAHPMELYPLELSAQRPPTRLSCHDDKEFEAALARVLGSSEIRHVLSRLRSQTI